MEKITGFNNPKNENTIQSQWIGMIYYAPRNLKQGNHLYPWMVRAFALERELEKHNYKLLSYSPANVNYNDKKVTGYMLVHNRFKTVTIPIPKVNYNFYIGSSNDEFLEFEKWAINENYQIYPVKPIRRLAGDKLLTAQTLKKYNGIIVPKTELYDENVDQIHKFMQENKSVFVKPRFGSMGDGIFVIKNENYKYVVNYYNDAKKKSETFANLSDCLPFIKAYADNEEYIIQEGINAIQHKGAIFDIRVIIFNIKQTLHFLSELRLGAKSSDLSNIAQGGESFNTQSELNKVFTKEIAQHILTKIKNTATEVVNFLNVEYEGKINEISLDIVIDKNEDIYIVELNVKPGLAGTPKLYNNFFIMNDEERTIYEDLALKHGEYLAKSLIDRCN